MAGKTKLILVGIVFLVLLGTGLSWEAEAGGTASTEVVTGSSDAARATATTPDKNRTPGNGGVDYSAILGAFAIILLAAAVGRFGARKLKQPQVLGELVFGIIIGTVLYQLGSPVVTIIRHNDLVGVEQEVLGRGLCWQDVVRQKLNAALLPPETARQIEGVLAPVFFVMMGVQVDLGSLLHLKVLLLAWP